MLVFRDASVIIQDREMKSEYMKTMPRMSAGECPLRDITNKWWDSTFSTKISKCTEKDGRREWSHFCWDEKTN